MTTVAVFGINGLFGKPIIEGLLTEPFISKVKFPIRLVTSSPDKKPVKSDKVKYINYKESSFTEAFKGVDVVINLGNVPFSPMKDILDAVVANKVKLYIPSQFTYDLEASNVDFPGFFGIKTAHSKAARTAGVKTVDVCCTYFYDGETFIGYEIPFYSVDKEADSVEVVGDDSTKIDFTYSKDVGLAVANLATYGDFARIPNKIRIYSDSTTIGALIAKYEKKHGVKLNTSFKDPKKFYSDLKEQHSKSGMDYKNLFTYFIAINAVGEGKGAIFETENEREFVNSNESLFKWTKFK